MLQKKKIKKDWDKTEGQWPHRKPVAGGDERIRRDMGKDSKATVLLKFLITKYIIQLAIIAKKTTKKYIES